MKNPRGLSSAARLRRYLPLVVIGATLHLQAEDSDRPRGYLHLQGGEFDTAWGVHDLWGLGLGMNFNRHWGAEVAGDVYELYDSFGEQSVSSLILQGRFRYPFLEDRLVLYAIVGAGPVFLQFNDSRGQYIGASIQSEGWRAGAAAGLGVEYFLADNVTFTLEGQYRWVQSLDTTVVGQSQEYDASTFLMTLGLRVYFSENQPRLLVEQESNVSTRFYFGARFGGSILTDDQLGPGVRLDPEASAIGSLNQYLGLSLGANFGENWGVELMLGNTEQRVIHEDFGILGEYAVYSALPLLRVRAPVGNGRWVPYLTAGFGASYAEWNDSRTSLRVEAEGIYPTVAVGAGIEYFITRNFSLCGDVWWQYTWGHNFQIASEQLRGDFSSFQATLGFRVYLFEARR